MPSIHINVSTVQKRRRSSITVAGGPDSERCRHRRPPPVVLTPTAEACLPAAVPGRKTRLDTSIARRLLAAALALGLLAELILDGPAYGINIPILVGAILAAGWLLRRRGRAPDPLDAWLPVTAVALAVFVAVRGDPMMALLDTAGALAFTGASIVAFSGLAVTRRSASVITMLGIMTIGASGFGAARVAQAARLAPDPRASRLTGRLAPLGRGLLIGIPLALIFAILFASADPIFRRGLSDLVGWRIDLGDLSGRILFVLASSWFAAGLLSVTALGLPGLERSSLGASARTEPILPAISVGLTEALVILVVIDIVVGLFVALQVAYLFGGQDTLVAAGMKYSDYARRGFFELVAAACLAGGVVVALETTVVRRSRPYLAALLALLALTAVVLVSAGLRLRLYQDAYGWTELRLYVLTAIVTLAAGLALMTALALGGRMRWLGHGLAVIGVVALLGLNAVAPASFVAARNVERVIDPTLVAPGGHAGLDAEYLGILPDDAVPVLVAALPGLPARERTEVLALLRTKRTVLAADPAFASPASWNLGRERARAALATLP
jgi:hypothetical protein